jgi:hypothetical protein
MRSTNVPQALRIGRAACVLVVCMTLLTGGPAAEAQSATPTIGGVNGSAASSGLFVRYAPEGLLPFPSLLDFGAPDALATISAGPSTFARAATADPGDLIANPDAILALLSSDYPAGTVPPWPLRVTATSGFGEPESEVAPAPGLSARATAEPNESTAVATMPGFDVRAVVTVGSQTATASTVTDGSSVTVHARSELSGIDIAGLVQVEALVIDLTATSTGGDTTLSGGTTVTGVTVAGQPATIDEEGVRAALGPIDLGTVLEAIGLRITAPGPNELDGGSDGRRAAVGLQIELTATAETVPGFGDVADGLPPLDSPIPGLPSAEDLLAAARASNVVTVDVGRAVVSLTTRAVNARPAPVVASPTSPLPSLTPTGPAARPAPAPVSTPSTPVAPSVTPAVATETPTSLPVGAGVGVVAALMVLLSPFIGDRLTRFAAVQLASDQEGCPWELR